MSEYIKIGLKVVWGCVILYWTLSSFFSKDVKSQESGVRRFLYYWLPLIVAILLLGPGSWFGHTFLRENFVSHTDTVGLIGLSISIVGAVLAIWSRVLLGRNWSLSVQQKQNHELIIKGPYRLVRHPIYSGLLLLFAGNAIIVGDYRGILAVLIVFASFWWKSRKEEALLIKTFGDQYVSYKRQTKAIIPFLL